MPTHLAPRVREQPGRIPGVSPSLGSHRRCVDTQRVAVVTGGAGAIGTAIASALRADGVHVVSIDRDGDIAADLTSESATRTAAAAVLEQHGRCDVFVHCPAAFDQSDLAHLDATTWRHVQAVNVESSLWLTQAFTPGMAERGFGRIVFVLSNTVWKPPTPVVLPYVASKGALLGIMRTLAVTLGADGIAVTAVAPGLTDTPGSRTLNTDEQFDAVVHEQAMKRRLTPADTAAAVAFLASDGAAAITGQVICTDGGLVLR
jgi:NAD(P)-dependent dehydrogenase (short-subunit alcohol dehydrogenase family)